MTEKIMKFSLLENAQSSLKNAILHLTSESEPTNVDIKYGILDVTQTVELPLKERLNSRVVVILIFLLLLWGCSNDTHKQGLRINGFDSHLFI